MRQIFVAALGLVLASCGTPVRQDTASGRPEVTVHHVASDRVKGALVSGMLNRGYRITKDSQFEIAFDRPVDNLAVAVLMGSKYDAQPNARVSYQIAQLGDDVRVVADMAIITNPGSAFERRMDVSAGADSPVIQAFLTTIAADLQKQQAPESKHNQPTKRNFRSPASAAVPAATSPAVAGYWVQVSSQRSESEARTAYQSLQSQFPSLLADREPMIHRVDLREGSFFRAMVGPFPTADGASNLCGALKAAGGVCLVQSSSGR